MTQIPFPAQGRDDSESDASQSLTTTRAARNVRWVNPRTGRAGGARRAGMSRATTVLGVSALRGSSSVVWDESENLFVQADPPDLVWELSGASKGDAYSVKIDAAGDIFVLEGGTHVLVRNRDGIEIERIVLPVGGCRALATDVGIQQIYVGVSSGEEDPEIFCYAVHPIRGWELLWRVASTGYVEKLVVYGGVLYAAENDLETGRSYVVRYTSLSTQGALLGLTQVPSPASVLDVSTATKNAGKIVVGSGINVDRGHDPRHPNTGAMLDRVFADWTWTDLDDFDDRRWCDFDPAVLSLNDGDQVLTWHDVGGSQRFFEVSPETVHVEAVQYQLIFQTVAPSDGDTLVFALPDGSESDTYTWRAAATLPFEITIGGSILSAYTALRDIMNYGDSLTPPSRFVRYDLGTLQFSCLAVHIAVDATTDSSGAVFKFRTGAAVGVTARIVSGRDVVPTAPRFRANGSSGRPCVYFDGLSNKMRTLSNTSIAPATATEQHTIFPAYGAGLNPDNSARFAFFMVFRSFPSYVQSAAVSQLIRRAGGGSWARQIIWNSDDAGDFAQDSLAFAERDNVTNRKHAATANGLVILSMVHNPTTTGPGQYEIYLNGEPMLNSVAVHTGQAVANDGTAWTTLGQSEVFDQYGQFWEGEIHRIRTLHGDDVPITTAERELIEGELAWEYGLQSQLPVTHPYLTAPPPPPSGTIADWYNARKVTGTLPILTAIDDSTGEIAWMAASDGTATRPLGGIGYGVKWNSEGDLYSVGPPSVYATDPSSVCKLSEISDDYSLVWSKQIGSTAGDTFTYDKLELDVDEFDNLYVPWNSDTSALQYVFLAYDSDGTVLYDTEAVDALAGHSVAVENQQSDTNVDLAQRVYLATRREWSMLVHIPDTFPGPSTALSNLDGRGISFDFEGLPSQGFFYRAVPALATDVAIGATRKECLENLRDVMIAYAQSVEPLYVLPTGIDDTLTPVTLRIVALKRVQGVNPVTVSPDAGYVNAGNAPYGGGTLFFDEVESNQESLNAKAYDLVDTIAPTGDTKQRAVVSVMDGDVHIFQGTAPSIVIAAGLDVNARYVQSATLLGRVFVTDGDHTYVVDPKASTAERYKPRTSGSFPRGVLGLEPWRARLVAFGLREDPYGLFGTAIGDPFDCDRGSEEQTRAFLLTVGDAGRCEDIVQGFIPYSDFLRQGAEISSIVLGDHSMWRYTGDPTYGGQLENISRTIGGAAGRAWALGPRGEIYVWSSTGGVYVLGSGSGPTPFTGRNVARAYESVDLSTHYMRIAWDQRLRTLFMVACPYGGVDAGSTIFAWEEHGAFWEDSSTHRITDMIVVDADKPDDRHTLLLCSDGIGRTWDKDADDDDGERIDASVTIGPLQGGELGVDVVLSHLQVIVEFASEPMRVEVWGSMHPGSIGSVLWAATLLPGVSPTLSVRRRASFLWIVLRGSRPWAFERMIADVRPGSVLGRAR